MTLRSHYDYIIIGQGLAGLQLAMAMNRDSFFKNKYIALIDPEQKNTNDKTWSFWEQATASKWQSLAYKTWQTASVYTQKKETHLKLAPYNYKSIRSIDFYNKAKSTLKTSKHIHFIQDTVTHVTNLNTKAEVKTQATKTYTANHVFDSRLPGDYHKANKATKLVQHFKGIVIKTDTPVFNTDHITMMDYRLKDGEKTSFTYVLPYTKNKALIEYTYFTKNTVKEEVYDTFLKTYIKDYLKVDNYQIIESETGQIPMTSFPFYKYNTKHITKIGTGGGWVKASTGYAFKNTEKKVKLLINNLKSNQAPTKGLYNKKHMFYDKIFLKVLHDNNEMGEWIFEKFYSKNTVNTMFKFLDESSSLYQELQIMSALFSWSFIKAFFKTLK